MSSSLALSGNDTFVAKVILEDSPYGVRSRVTKTLSGTGGAPVWRKRIVSAFAILLLLVSVTVSLFAQTQRDTQANWFTDAMRNVFCSTPAYFNEPVAWQNGFSSMAYGSMGSSVGLLSAQGKYGFLDKRITADAQFGSGGAKWTVYAGESQDSVFMKNNSNRVDISEKEENGVYEDQRYATFQETCIPVGAIVSTSAANSIAGITHFLTDVSGWLISQAYDPEWVNSLNDASARVVTGEDADGNETGQGLRDALYLEFLNLVIFMGAIWLFYTGVAKRRTTEAVSGALYMVGAVIAGSLLVYNPSILPNITNSITSEVSSAILVGTAGSASNVSSTQGSSSDYGRHINLCYSDANKPLSAEERTALGRAGISIEETEISNRRDYIIAGANCQLWRAFVYEPWVVGQFGTSSSELYKDFGSLKPPAVDLGDGETVNNWAVYQLAQQVMTADEIQTASESGLDNMNVYADNMSRWFNVVDAVASPEGDVSYYSAWAGNDGGSRIGIATAALVASTFAILIVSVLAMGMLAYSVAAAILMFVSVVFFLLGAHPGLGRRLAMRWFEMYVGAVLKKIILALMLSMMIAFYSAILSGAGTSWGTSVLAIIAISIAILMYRKELLNTISSSVNFGGSGFGEEGANKAASITKGVVGGAAMGLAVGGVKGAKAGSAIMKSGTGTRVARVGSAIKATAAGATKGATRSAMHAGTHAGGYMNNPLMQVGSIAGRAAEYGPGSAGSVQQAHEIRHGAKDAAKRYAQHQQALAEWKKGQSRNNVAYMDAYNANKGNKEWEDSIKRRYGLKYLPNPYEQAFDGYGKDPTTWEKGDAPRAYATGDNFAKDVPVAPPVYEANDADSAPSGWSDENVENSEQWKEMINAEEAHLEKLSKENARSSGTVIPNNTTSRSRNNTGSDQSSTSGAGKRPSLTNTPVYADEAERKLNEAIDKSIAKQRAESLNNSAKSMPKPKPKPPTSNILNRPKSPEQKNKK